VLFQFNGTEDHGCKSGCGRKVNGRQSRSSENLSQACNIEQCKLKNDSEADGGKQGLV
jgi:hypothetical protein